MLLRTDKIIGCPIAARDGDIGKVHDVIFDDRDWNVRYLVVDTSRWLPGRQVLISPLSAGRFDWNANRLPLDLTKDQIESSPNLDTDLPIDLKSVVPLHAYYGWPLWWSSPIDASIIDPMESEEHADPNLRSARKVSGYQIEASDGDIGHVDTLIVDEREWKVRYFVVDTRNFIPGKKVLVAPMWITSLSWTSGFVKVSMPREQIKNSPEYDPSMTVDRAYEIRLFDYYRRPHYWI